MLVTLDTNVSDVGRISEFRAAVGDRAVSFVTVTVNEPERGDSPSRSTSYRGRLCGAARYRSCWFSTRRRSGAGSSLAMMMLTCSGGCWRSSRTVRFRTWVRGTGSRHRNVASFETRWPSRPTAVSVGTSSSPTTGERSSATPDVNHSGRSARTECSAGRNPTVGPQRGGGGARAAAGSQRARVARRPGFAHTSAPTRSDEETFSVVEGTERW
jgi:hypothetical protein